MKSHEKLPSLDEVKEFNQMLRSGGQLSELQITEDMEKLQAAKLEALHMENEDLKAQLAAATQAPEDPLVGHSYTVLLQLIARPLGLPRQTVMGAKDAVDNIQKHISTKNAKIAALEQGVKSLQELVRELATVRQSDKDELQAKLEDAESEAARLEMMAMEGAEALARERENSTRIKRESDAVREENQKIRDRIGFEKDLAKRAQAEVRRLRNLIREFFAQDESFEVREALGKAVE